MRPAVCLLLFLLALTQRCTSACNVCGCEACDIGAPVAVVNFVYEGENRKFSCQQLQTQLVANPTIIDADFCANELPKYTREACFCAENGVLLVDMPAPSSSPTIEPTMAPQTGGSGPTGAFGTTSSSESGGQSSTGGGDDGELAVSVMTSNSTSGSGGSAGGEGTSSSSGGDGTSTSGGSSGTTDGTAAPSGSAGSDTNPAGTSGARQNSFAAVLSAAVAAWSVFAL
jgi:hypothetical protein